MNWEYISFRYIQRMNMFLMSRNTYLIKTLLHAPNKNIIIKKATRNGT